MDRSLWLLLRLRSKSWLRRWVRNLRSLKGTLLALVGALVFLPMLVFAFLAPAIHGGSQLALVRRFGPLMLFAYCVLTVLLSAGEKAISFSPAEVDFLFAGPYRRRQLLLYKVVGSLGVAGLSALFMLLVLGHHAARTLSAFVGLYLSLELLYLFTLVVGLAASTVGALAYDRRRRGVLLALGILAVAALLPSGREVFQSSSGEILGLLERSPVFRAILLPFRPFALAFASERLWPDLAVWAGVALAVDLGLVALALAMNAQYYEVAADASARVYARLKQARRGIPWNPPSRAHFSLPMLPWWGGIGPNLWRQAITAARQPGRFFALFVMFLAPVITLYMTIGASAATGGEVDLSPVALAAMGGMALFAPTMVGFDFRTDVARIEELKVLPIPPKRLVFGQIMAPALILTLGQWFSLATVAGLSRPGPTLLAGAVALSLPLNVLLVEIENLFFLWYPVPFVQGLSIDFETTGRQLLLMMAKGACAGLVAAVASGIGAAGFFLTDGSWTAALVAAWLVVAGACWALLPLLALAFTQFDVARDTPV